MNKTSALVTISEYGIVEIQDAELLDIVTAGWSFGFSYRRTSTSNTTCGTDINAECGVTNNFCPAQVNGACGQNEQCVTSEMAL